VALLATFVALLLLSGLLAYAIRGREGALRVATPSASPVPVPSAEPTERGGNSVISELFGPDHSGVSQTSYASLESIAARILLRFSLAAFLAAILAFRPRRGISLGQRNPYVAQTQILMAVVAASMMMVVGDSAARAFGIFAAASLVRFRTNIKDPKEITVLLICLGVGLAAGIGRWDMAVILSLFVLLTLSILEYFEQAQVFRVMEVKICTRNVDTSNDGVRKVFEQHGFDLELRELNRQDEDEPLGKIMYQVNISPKISTDELSEEILAADPENIDSVEWEQKKSDTYHYR
jgi:uncharacterized membrane protein YhiD involved in acid resistance